MGADRPLPRRDEAMLNGSWGDEVEVENFYRDRFVCPFFPTPSFTSVNKHHPPTFHIHLKPSKPTTIYFTNAPRC